MIESWIVSRTLKTTRPRSPPTPGADRKSPSDVGGCGSGEKPLFWPLQGLPTVLPAMNRENARLMQPVRSLSVASWPLPGSATTLACGSCVAVARAFSMGVRRSRRPPSRSAGTSGSGPVNGGLRAAGA